MQKLGQHFLKNHLIIVKIIEVLDVQDGDTVIEIGPGHGELTVPLERKCAEKNARLIAIEKDEKLIDELRAKVQELGTKSLEIVLGDVLEILPSLISKSQNLKISRPRGTRIAQEAAKYKIVGNIPYYLTGHLLRIVGELEPRPERCVFMIQKEVAERIVAKPPGMNRLAASVQFWSDPKIIAGVSRGDFVPSPKVASAVVVIKTKTGDLPIDSGRYYAAVRALFAQPRKTILNNLSYEVGAMRREKEGADRERNKQDLSEKLSQIGIDPGARPQNLSIEDIIAVAKTFF